MPAIELAADTASRPGQSINGAIKRGHGTRTGLEDVAVLPDGHEAESNAQFGQDRCLNDWECAPSIDRECGHRISVEHFLTLLLGCSELP
jgi:hypothetical protein